MKALLGSAAHLRLLLHCDLSKLHPHDNYLARVDGF